MQNSSDPFLRFHQVHARQFSISYPFTPISIRDQMVRAKMFVDRVTTEGLVNQNKPLLVVGAGAAGIAVALEAVQRDLRVLVIERDSLTFKLQRKCFSRWIDPTLYDWPWQHWSAGVFPWISVSAPSVALPWGASQASLLADHWDGRLLVAVSGRPDLIEVRYNCQLAEHTPPSSDENELTVTLQPQGMQSSVETFGCMVWAVGFGSEKSSSGVYTGYDFWDTDDLDLERAGCSHLSAQAKVRIVICGGGDGALQDAIRAVTGLASMTSLITALHPHIPEAWLVSLLTEEENVRRQGIWTLRSAKQALHEAMSGLHRLYEEAALAALRNPEVLAVLDKISGPRLSALDVRLFHSCEHFDQCYGLNRFLALLLERWAQIRKASFMIIRNASLKNVSGHDCDNVPALPAEERLRVKKRRCYGQQHGTSFEFSHCLGGIGPDYSVDADVLLLRFGVTGFKNLPMLDASNVPWSTQLLPFLPS